MWQGFCEWGGMNISHTGLALSALVVVTTGLGLTGCAGSSYGNTSSSAPAVGVSSSAGSIGNASPRGVGSVSSSAPPSSPSSAAVTSGPATGSASANAPGKLIAVVAAENFYGDLASQIGGRHVSVVS